MKRGRGAFVTVLLAAVTALASGCGEDDEGTTARSVTESAPKPAYAIPAPLKEIERRLHAVGISAHATGLVEGEAQMEGTGLEITYFADPRHAAKEGSELVKIATNHPQKILAVAFGQIVAWTANQNGLTRTERAQFEEVAAVMDSLP